MCKTRRGNAVQEEKSQAAHARQQLREQRTPAQQLTELDERLGPGVGAERERTRLIAQIEAEKGE